MLVAVGFAFSLMERMYFILNYFEVSLIFKLAFQPRSLDLVKRIKRRKCLIYSIIVLFMLSGLLIIFFGTGETMAANSKSVIMATFLHTFILTVLIFSIIRIRSFMTKLKTENIFPNELLIFFLLVSETCVSVGHAA